MPWSSSALNKQSGVLVASLARRSYSGGSISYRYTKGLIGDADLNILASSRFAKFVFDVVNFEAICSVGKAE